MVDAATAITDVDTALLAWSAALSAAYWAASKIGYRAPCPSLPLQEHRGSGV
jgi:hypothetical protein